MFVSDKLFSHSVVYGTNLFEFNGIYFINQSDYYPETLYPLVTAGIGGVKTIRTLRNDAPLTVSNMKGQSRDWGKAAPRLSRWIAPDPIRTPLHAVPQRLGRGILLPDGRAANHPFSPITLIPPNGASPDV